MKSTRQSGARTSLRLLQEGAGGIQRTVVGFGFNSQKFAQKRVNIHRTDGGGVSSLAEVGSSREENRFHGRQLIVVPVISFGTPIQEGFGILRGAGQKKDKKVINVNLTNQTAAFFLNPAIENSNYSGMILLRKVFMVFLFLSRKNNNLRLFFQIFYRTELTLLRTMCCTSSISQRFLLNYIHMVTV